MGQIENPSAIFRKLKKFSSEEILNGNYPSNQYWYILIGEEILGPFHQDDFSSCIEEAVPPSTTLISNYVSHPEWRPLRSTPFFQNKKLKESSEKGPVPVFIPTYEKNIFVLQNGQKNGPYTPQDIQNLLQKNEILFSDLISIDDGHTWLPIKHSSLKLQSENRMTKRNLPTPIDEREFSGEGEHTSQILRKRDEENDNQLITLAKAGKKKTKSHIHSLENKDSPSLNFQQKIKLAGKKYWKPGIVLATFGLGVYFSLQYYSDKGRGPLSKLSRFKDQKSQEIKKRYPKSQNAQNLPRPERYGQSPTQSPHYKKMQDRGRYDRARYRKIDTRESSVSSLPPTSSNRYSRPQKIDTNPQSASPPRVRQNRPPPPREAPEEKDDDFPQEIEEEIAYPEDEEFNDRSQDEEDLENEDDLGEDADFEGSEDYDSYEEDIPQ